MAADEAGEKWDAEIPLVHSGKVFDLKSFYIRSSVNGKRTDGC